MTAKLLNQFKLSVSLNNKECRKISEDKIAVVGKSQVYGVGTLRIWTQRAWKCLCHKNISYLRHAQWKSFSRHFLRSKHTAYIRYYGFRKSQQNSGAKYKMVDRLGSSASLYRVRQIEITRESLRERRTCVINLVPRLLSTLPVPSRCERTLVLSGHVISQILGYRVICH